MHNGFTHGQGGPSRISPHTLTTDTLSITMPWKLLPEVFLGIHYAKNLAWLPLQSLAVKKIFFLCKFLGGEKLLKFGEKCR